MALGVYFGCVALDGHGWLHGCVDGPMIKLVREYMAVR